MNKVAPILLRTTSFAWYSAIVLLLAAGWSMREQNYLVAESGIGYWFGIIGSTMMLLLLVYPFRKRYQRWSMIGSVKFWFRIHMILGIVGPVVIIFHSGFSLGSFNSSVAFFCMLIVAVSGLIGRWLYQRIHHGLYGRKIRFEALYRDDELSGLLLSGSSAIDFDLVDELEQLKQALTHRHTGVNRSIGFFLQMKKRVASMQQELRGSELGAEEKREMLRRLQYLRSICKFGIYEILFSYWHILHLPLFVMLILSGLFHVVAVHLY